MIPVPARRKGQSAINALWLVIALLSAAVVYLVFQAASLGDQVTRLSTDVSGNRTATYQSRSVGCRILLAHGLHPPQDDPCNDARVLRYYDPADVPSAATSQDAMKNRRVSCEILRRLDGDDPACQGL